MVLTTTTTTTTTTTDNEDDSCIVLELCDGATPVTDADGYLTVEAQDNKGITQSSFIAPATHCGNGVY